MDADELVWVHGDEGGTGGAQNNVCGDKNGRAGPDLGPMAREISPNIMFYKKQSKKGADDSGWVHMGPHGCSREYFHEGTGKKGENGAKSVIMTCFAGVLMGNKNIT